MLVITALFCGLSLANEDESRSFAKDNLGGVLFVKEMLCLLTKSLVSNQEEISLSRLRILFLMME